MSGSTKTFRTIRTLALLTSIFFTTSCGNKPSPSSNPNEPFGPTPAPLTKVQSDNFKNFSSDMKSLNALSGSLVRSKDGGRLEFENLQSAPNDYPRLRDRISHSDCSMTGNFPISKILFGSLSMDETLLSETAFGNNNPGFPNPGNYWLKYNGKTCPIDVGLNMAIQGNQQAFNIQAAGAYALKDLSLQDEVGLLEAKFDLGATAQSTANQFQLSVKGGATLKTIKYNDAFIGVYTRVDSAHPQNSPASLNSISIMRIKAPGFDVELKSVQTLTQNKVDAHFYLNGTEISQKEFYDAMFLDLNKLIKG